MRKEIYYISLISISIFFIGCGDNDKTVAINNIEKSINKKSTTVGCGKNGNNSSNGECNQNRDSAEFILNVLAKDKELKDNNRYVDGGIERNSLLDNTTKEIHKKSKLKEGLIELVDKVDNSKDVKKKKLEDFINSIDEVETNDNVEDFKKISVIKEELNNLVELGSRDLKSKDIKKELESLIKDVTESKKSLIDTQKSLIELVKSAEKKNTISAKKFASAIIKDVKNKKIAIVEENDKYFVIKVQKGDNLSILAKRYYNDKKKYRLIYEANRDKINSNYEIFPNTKLIIPKI